MKNLMNDEEMMRIAIINENIGGKHQIETLFEISNIWIDRYRLNLLNYIQELKESSEIITYDTQYLDKIIEYLNSDKLEEK